MAARETSVGWLKDLFSNAHTEEEWLEMFRKLPVAEQRRFQGRLKATGFTICSSSPLGSLLREIVPAPVILGADKE